MTVEVSTDRFRLDVARIHRYLSVMITKRNPYAPAGSRATWLFPASPQTTSNQQRRQAGIFSKHIRLGTP